jgi:hypothetical protein
VVLIGAFVCVELLFAIINHVPNHCRTSDVFALEAALNAIPHTVSIHGCVLLTCFDRCTQNVFKGDIDIDIDSTADIRHLQAVESNVKAIAQLLALEPAVQSAVPATPGSKFQLQSMVDRAVISHIEATVRQSRAAETFVINMISTCRMVCSTR